MISARAVFLSLLALCLLLPGLGLAYPTMVRHDYASCSTCHADPSGGSLLTAYGRATGELLLRSPYGAAADRDPGTVGNFLFGVVNLPESVLLGASLRGMGLRSGTLGGNAALRVFPMQADLTGQLTVWKVRANASLGYGSGSPTLPATLVGDTGAQLISRQHWLGVDLGADSQWLVRLGRMPLPFGIRSVEHTQWVRSETRTDTNVAQQHGLSVAYNLAPLRAEVMGIVGNLTLRPADYRELGYSGYVEWAPKEKLAVGVSSLITHSRRDVATAAPMWRHAHGLFARYAPHPKVVLSAENDFTLFSQPTTVNLWGMASLLQLDYEPLQGVHLIGAGELKNRGLGYRQSSYGAWGSLAWFFAPHADVRTDVVWRQEPKALDSSDSLALMAQLHFYL